MSVVGESTELQLRTKRHSLASQEDAESPALAAYTETAADPTNITLSGIKKTGTSIKESWSFCSMYSISQLAPVSIT